VKVTSKIIVIGLSILGFVGIRLYQGTLFYDPLIQFYKSNFQNASFPELHFWSYNLHLLFRYSLNTILSLLVLWMWFEKKSYLVFSVLLYAIVFVLATLAFWFIAHDISAQDYMKLFYIRRFLIQPILVIILIPAFYFQHISKKG